MTARARSKYADNNSRTASGSRLSDNGVKPTRSANRSETMRRSETGTASAGAAASAAATGGELATSAAVAAAPSDAPHSLQNFPEPAAAPHCGHVAAMDAPHSEQNFAPARLAAPQLRQTSSATG